MEELLEQAHLVFTADERRLELLAAVTPATLGHHAHRAPRSDRCLLALQLLIGLALEGDRVAGRSLSRLADEHGSRFGRGLEPAGGVDEVTGDHALALRADRDCGLAGQDTGARLDAGAERTDLLDQVQRRAHGALRVIFLRDGRAPNGHDRIADELLDGAAVAADDLSRHVEVARQRLANVLCVALLGERREADEVGKEHAHDAPFRDGFDDRHRARRRRRSGAGRQRRRALRAELRARQVDEAAIGAAGRQCSGALHAELRAGYVLCSAIGTDQARSLVRLVSAQRIPAAYAGSSDAGSRDKVAEVTIALHAV